MLVLQYFVDLENSPSFVSDSGDVERVEVHGKYFIVHSHSNIMIFDEKLDLLETCPPHKNATFEIIDDRLCCNGNVIFPRSNDALERELHILIRKKEQQIIEKLKDRAIKKELIEKIRDGYRSLQSVFSLASDSIHTLSYSINDENWNIEILSHELKVKGRQMVSSLRYHGLNYKIVSQIIGTSKVESTLSDNLIISSFELDEISEQFHLYAKCVFYMDSHVSVKNVLIGTFKQPQS